MAAEHTREEEELEEDTLFDQAGLLTNRIKKRSDTRTTSIGGKRITPMKTLSLCLAFFSLGLGAMIIEPTLFDLQRLIGTEIHVIALILVARSVGYILGSILGMILFERYNRQFILYLSMLAIMISLGLIPWCTSFVANFIVVTSLGIFMRILFAGGNVLCLDLWGRHSGPFLQAIHFSMGLGFFIAPLLSETILSEGTSSSSMPSNLPFLNLSVSPPLALPASSLQIERFHHNHNGIVMRLPRSIVNDTVPTGTDSYKIVVNNTAVNDTNQSTVTDFLKLEYTVAATTESLLSLTTTTAAAVTGTISNTDLNSTAFSTLTPSGLSDSDIDDDKNETDSLLTEVNSTITNSENNSLTSENRTTINNPVTPEKTTTTTTTDSSAVVTHKPKPPFTDGNKLPKAKNSWVRKKEDMTEHVVNKPAAPTTSSSNIISSLPSTTKVADKNASTVITELNNVTKTLLRDKLPTVSPLMPNVTTLNPHLNSTQIESNVFNATSDDLELVSNFPSRNESSSKGPMELPIKTIINSSSISTSNLLSESLKLNNTESSTVTVSSPIVPTDSTSNPLQITDPIPTTVPVVALNNSTNKGISIFNSSMISTEVASVNPVTTVSSATSSQNTPSTVSSPAPTVETLLMKSTFQETTKNNVTLSAVLDGKTNSDFSIPIKENQKPISLLNHQYVTQDPEMKTSLPLKSAFPSANYLDIPEPIPIEAAATPKNDSTTEVLIETSTYFTKTVSLQRNDYYLQNISHKKPFTFNNETEETQLFFGNFMHTVVDLGFSKLHVLYTIITLIVLLTSLVFLSFLCHNPRELRSKQEDEVKPGNQDDRFTYIMIGLMFFFYFSYTSCEVIFSQLFLGLLLESNMKVVLYKGSVLISVFWGIYAGTRGISICCANSFKPVVMILMDLVCCIVSSSALSIFNTEVEILLWCNLALMAFGLASIIPSSLMWLENFIHISNKAACVFLLGSALAEFFIALLMGHPFSLPTISCIYACLIFSIASLLIFGLMWRLASWRGEKYCFSKADVKYQLTSQVDEEEDAFELSSGNSSLYLLNNGNNNTNGHLMQEQNGSAFSVRNKKPYWK